MAQYRALHTKITQSFDFNEMPDDFTRLMWALMPLALDSEGRGIFNSSWLRSKLFPLREDVTAKQIMAAMEWMIGRGMIVPYEVEGRQYFYSPTFKSYQRGLEREAASVLPSPELVESRSGVGQELVTSNSCSNGTELNKTQTELKESEPEFSNSVPESAIKAWNFAIGDLQQQIPKHVFETYVANLRLERVENKTFIVRAINKPTAELVVKRYGAVLNGSIQGHYGSPTKLEVTT